MFSCGRVKSSGFWLIWSTSIGWHVRSSVRLSVGRYVTPASKYRVASIGSGFPGEEKKGEKPAIHQILAESYLDTYFIHATIWHPFARKKNKAKKQKKTLPRELKNKCTLAVSALTGKSWFSSMICKASGQYQHDHCGTVRSEVSPHNEAPQIYGMKK